jgi:hypothetical protein
MKKRFLPFLFLATVLVACSTPSDKKSETSTASSTSEGTITKSGPDVELIKKAAESWAKGDWDAYLSCYTDTAVSVHNAWATNDTSVAKKMTSFIDLFKKSREYMVGGVVTINNSIYEVVTMADGSKYGHAWVDVSWKTKKGGEGKTVLFNSFGIKDGKITYEWPIYNPKAFDELMKN